MRKNTQRALFMDKPIFHKFAEIFLAQFHLNMQMEVGNPSVIIPHNMRGGLNLCQHINLSKAGLQLRLLLRGPLQLLHSVVAVVRAMEHFVHNTVATLPPFGNYHELVAM
jgi:hypothetical protein